MIDDLAPKFARFSQDRLRPAVAVVEARKRRGLRVSAAVALALFVILALVIYVTFAPYAKLMSEHSIASWPVFLLIPLSLAVIAFCIAYILCLRGAVAEFRETLIGRIGEFIFPGVVHEANTPPEPDVLVKSLLFVGAGQPAGVGERFRGRVGDAVVSFSELRVSPGKDAAAGPLSGVFCAAVFPRAFKTPLVALPASAPASISGLAEKLAETGDGREELLRLDDPDAGLQVVVPASHERTGRDFLASAVRSDLREIRDRFAVDAFLSCRGDALSVALLSRGQPGGAGAIEEFNMDAIREFCRRAGACLQLARAVGRTDGLWQK